MDEKRLTAIKTAMEWEACYRLRKKGKKDGKYFLAEICDLDNDFSKALIVHNIKSGRLLEVGCGLGSQAVQFARLGFEVTATEVSDTALAQASALALDQGVTVEFLNDNILYSRLVKPFDVVVDRGCFTILPEVSLDLYVENVSRFLNQGGFLLLKVDKKRQERIDLLLESFDLVDRASGQYLREGDEADGRMVESIFAVLKTRIPTS